MLSLQLIQEILEGYQFPRSFPDNINVVIIKVYVSLSLI